MNRATVALLLVGSASALRLNELKPRKVKAQADETEVAHEVADHEIEVWYINLKENTDRAACMEKQIQSLGFTPMRFEATRPTQDGLKEGGAFYDCVKGGFKRNKEYVDASEGYIAHGDKTKMAIIGDFCSHKRLFQHLAERNTTAKYFVVLEDDAVLNPEPGQFRRAVNEFVDEKWGYDGPHSKDWQMVQLDFIGSFCKKHVVGVAAGKTVFKPKDIRSADGSFGAGCARYFGSQAMLMQKPTLTSVVDHMESHKVVPMDWVPADLPQGLSWRPKIAKSPIQKFNKLPEFCKGNVKKSTIGHASFLDTTMWADAFSSQTKAEEDGH